VAGQALGNLIGAWFQTAFYVAMFLVLFSTNIGVVDYVGRLAADSLKVTFLKSSSFWSESKIYLAVVVRDHRRLCHPVDRLGAHRVAGHRLGRRRFLMAFYSVLLIALNRKALSDFARLKGWRLPLMVLIAAFYVSFAAYLLYRMITLGPAAVV
jgi:hypothetical protein